MTGHGVTGDPQLEAQEQGLLGHCPVCRYALVGLPIEHRCPECGFPFDRRWQVHGGVLLGGGRKGRFTGRGLFIFFAIYLGMMLAGITFLPLPRPPRMLLMVFMLFALALVFWAALRQARRFIALGPDGILVFHSRRHIDRYPWAQIGRARYDLLRKSLAFKHGDANVRLPVDAFFGTSITSVDACVRAINAYPRPAIQSSIVNHQS
jgi:hypothetical protein